MDIIEGYIDYIKDKKIIREYSGIILYGYKKIYGIYKSKSIKLVDIVENDIISYLIKLEKDNVSIATIARMISSIKSFHDYLFLNHICTNNPAKDIKKPKIKKENINILTEEEIERLLNFPKLTTPKLIRDKAILKYYMVLV